MIAVCTVLKSSKHRCYFCIAPRCWVHVVRDTGVYIVKYCMGHVVTRLRQHTPSLYITCNYMVMKQFLFYLQAVWWGIILEKPTEANIQKSRWKSPLQQCWKQSWVSGSRFNSRVHAYSIGIGTAQSKPCKFVAEKDRVKHVGATV